MMEILLIISQLLILSAVLYFIWDSKNKDRSQQDQTLITFNQTVNNVISFITDENKKLYDALEKVQIKYFDSIEKSQIKYFDSLEKHSQKSNLLVEKNGKEFLKVFSQVFKKVETESPKALDADKVENSIETASGPEDVLLTDTDRIPIVEGVNIKFEDENETVPININPVESYQEDKSVNPIEK